VVGVLAEDQTQVPSDPAASVCQLVLSLAQVTA
jgi:hypothetical protein